MWAVLCAMGYASAAEPRENAAPSGFVVTADEAALNAIIGKVRLRSQGLGQPEVIPAGSPVNAVAPSDGRASDGEPWRIQWFDGRWWYWTLDSHWKWWDERQGWVDFNPTAVVTSEPPLVWSGSYYSMYDPGCYGYQPVQVAVAPGAVTVSAGPVYVSVGGGHVGVSVFGIGFGF
jgi:hypothetical protein